MTIDTTDVSFPPPRPFPSFAPSSVNFRILVGMLRTPLSSEKLRPEWKYIAEVTNEDEMFSLLPYWPI